MPRLFLPVYAGERPRASLQECVPFNERAFKQVLKKIRVLTRKPNPQVFVPRLESLYAQCGVAVVFVPELPKMEVSSATR